MLGGAGCEEWLARVVLFPEFCVLVKTLNSAQLPSEEGVWDLCWFKIYFLRSYSWHSLPSFCSSSCCFVDDSLCDRALGGSWPFDWFDTQRWASCLVFSTGFGTFGALGIGGCVLLSWCLWLIILSLFNWLSLTSCFTAELCWLVAGEKFWICEIDCTTSASFWAVC